MRYHIFKEANVYPIAILIKGSTFNKQELLSNYVSPLKQLGISEEKLIAFTLEYDRPKVSSKCVKDYLTTLLPVLEEQQTKFLYVADATYFKAITGQSKADPHFGYALPCKIKGYAHMTVVLGMNYQALIYNPSLQHKLDMSLSTLTEACKGTLKPLGTGIIHSAAYPRTLEDIAAALEALHQHPRLSCDIEAFSLKFDKAGIGTIAFAWDKHNGVAFPVDYEEYAVPVEGFHGWQGYNREIYKLLRKFFSSYQGELTFHNATYDIKVLIYSLWMLTPLDTEGLLEGLDIMTRHAHDTKIISYLALNSTAGKNLGLKAQAHEFAGNWAVEEIKNICKVPLDKLLQYNLVDALSTNYVREKNYPIMVQDNQETLYKTLMLSSMKLIIQMELTGMPMNVDTIKKTKHKLEAICNKQISIIRNNSFIQTLNVSLRTNAMHAANAKLKVKQHPLDKFSDVEFNPNSGPQLQKLLYEQLGLPVLDYTDKKQPATGADTLEKLINHTDSPEQKEFLAALIAYGKVSKILSTFIPAFEAGVLKRDGMLYLHGCFNIGPVSGRLSSSDPNLQNIPANSIYAELIKFCFEAPRGWLFVGADFNSLEDYVSALTTKDPNKLAVYEKGYDGHSLRAAYYFREQCPEINLDDPISVNSIKEIYPELRQDSKAPTFLLTYGGTYHGMMHNLGWSEEKSKEIEKGYHELYKVSDEYIKQRLQQASVDGYVDVAFGLRVRTPLLKQIVPGSSGIPYEAAAEGRTAGNALGQSYGLLNNRAAVEFMQKVWASPYRCDVKPVALIHDAIYLLIRDNVEVVEWVNRELIKSMQWQELPELEHPTVKLGAALDIFWPTWANPITIPNNASRETIINLCNASKEKLLEAA